MLNTVSLQGRLTRDKKNKKTQNNISLVDFNQQQTNHCKGQREQTTLKIDKPKQIAYNKVVETFALVFMDIIDFYI